jgi:hypothetical protein
MGSIPVWDGPAWVTSIDYNIRSLIEVTSIKKMKELVG